MLGPFPGNDGPIEVYRGFRDEHLGSQPILGGPAVWLRVAIMLLGWSFILYQWAKGRLSQSRKQIIAVACAVLVLAQILSSGYHDLADGLVVWIPAVTLILASKRMATALFWFLVVLLVLQILFGVGAYAINYRQFASPIVGKRASGLMGTPSAVYPIYLIATFLFLSLAITQKHLSSKISCRLLSFMAAALTVLTFTRGAWIGLAAGLSPPMKGQSVRSRVLSLITAAGLVLAALFVRGGPLASPQKLDGSTIGHMSSVKAGFEVLPSLALAGGGPHAFQDSAVYQRIQKEEGIAPVEPLCLWLNLALDWGLPGMLMFGFAAFQGMRLEVERHESAIGYSRSVIAIAVSGLSGVPVFGEYLSLPATAALTALLFLLFSLPSRRPDSALEPKLTSPEPPRVQFRIPFSRLHAHV